MGGIRSFQGITWYLRLVPLVVQNWHTSPANNPAYSVCGMIQITVVLHLAWPPGFFLMCRNNLFIEWLMCALLHHRDTCEPSDAAHHIFTCTFRHTPSEIIMFCHESMEHDGEKLKQKVVEEDPEDQEQRSCLTTQLHRKKVLSYAASVLCLECRIHSAFVSWSRAAQAIKHVEIVNHPSRVVVH